MLREILVDRTICVLDTKIFTGTSNRPGRKTRGQKHLKRNNHQELPACSCQRAFSSCFFSFPNQTGESREGHTGHWGLLGFATPVFVGLGFFFFARGLSLVLGSSSGGWNFPVCVSRSKRSSEILLCVLTDFPRIRTQRTLCPVLLFWVLLSALVVVGFGLSEDLEIVCLLSSHHHYTTSDLRNPKGFWVSVGL